MAKMPQLDDKNAFERFDDISSVDIIDDDDGPIDKLVLTTDESTDDDG